MMRTSLLAALTALIGCTTGTPGPSDVSDGLVVPDGKADDFLSLTAAEFVVEGRTTVTLEEDLRGADEETRMARVRELVGYEQVLLSWFLTQYFIDKKSDDSNSGYGGYAGMAKANTVDELDIRQEDELTYSFAIQQLIAADDELLDRLPTQLRPDGAREFVLTVGTPSNEEMARLETNHEWYRSAPWSSWNPETVADEKKEDLTLTIRPEVASEDAWFDYAGLFEDGILSIDVHFGWDYHGDYHVKHAESLFGWLSRNGYDAPVDEFAALDRTSGPFTRTLDANGREVEVRVRIFYGQTGGDTDPDTDAGGRVLEDDVRASLRDSDVIVYSGHSGPFYGFAMGNWRRTEEGDFDDSEMASAEMPENRYQLVVAEGCDTYHIGEAFRRNPAKPEGRFIDIITTTAPSNASTPGAVQDTIAHLTETDGEGRHRPRTMRSLLRDLDSNSYWFHTMYGVHGIDDNPQLHPYAEAENLCGECAVDADCGGLGNRCVEVGASGRRCAASCTTTAGCPDGFSCRDVASASSRVIYDQVCVPQDLSCG